MAYADQEMSGNRIVAIIIVALIHVAIGYVLITGLAYSAVKKVVERVTTVDIEEPEPEPEVIPDEPPVAEDPAPEDPVAEDPPVEPEPEIIPDEPPAPVADPLPVLDDFVLDIAAPDGSSLKRGASVVESEDGLSVRLDSKSEHVALNDLSQFDGVDQLAFSISFTISF